MLTFGARTPLGPISADRWCKHSARTNITTQSLSFEHKELIHSDLMGIKQKSLGEPLDTIVSEGPVVDEIHRTYSESWVTQIIRLYHEENLVEIGPTGLRALSRN